VGLIKTVMDDPASCGPVKPNRSQEQMGPHAALFELHNTGEVVETKGGNHKTLKEWKSKYGSDKVESWLAK